MDKLLLPELKEWKALEQHCNEISTQTLNDLFATQTDRRQRYSVDAAGLRLDYSKNLCNDKTLNLLMRLARVRQLDAAVKALFSGECVNTTERAPALHTALRHSLVNDVNVSAQVRESQRKMASFVQKIRGQEYLGVSGKPIQQIVNIGIGGSDLGPKMAVYALEDYAHPELEFYFVSNLDQGHIKRILKKLDPETTLFIISSKSFSTKETLLNAQTAKRWLRDALPQGVKESDLSPHFIAVTAQVDRAEAFGIPLAYVLPLWSWVGGRYSIWSTVGFSLALAIGMERFYDFLAGANAMDKHFANAPFEENMPVMMALISIWCCNFLHCQTRAIIPYTQSLLHFPHYLQQLHMESQGKRVQHDGSPVQYATGAIIWGGVGSNTQHSFHQLLFQGTQPVPIDIILPLRDDKNQEPVDLIANCLAQSELLAFGYEAKDCSYKSIRGNCSHNMIFMDAMTPKALGALLALYEHKVYVQSVLWNIDAFDQWGVERGKLLATSIAKKLTSVQGDNKVNDLLKML